MIIYKNGDTIRFQCSPMVHSLNTEMFTTWVEFTPRIARSWSAAFNLFTGMQMAFDKLCSFFSNEIGFGGNGQRLRPPLTHNGAIMNKIRIKAKQKRPAAGLAPLPLPIHYRIMAANTRGCKGFLSFKETEIGKQTRQNGSFLKTKTVITRSLPQLVGGKGHVYSVGAPFAKVFCFLGEGDVTWHRWPIRGHGTHLTRKSRGMTSHGATSFDRTPILRVT